MGRPIRTRRFSAHGDVCRDSLCSPLRYFPERKQQMDKVLPGVRFCHLATGIAARRWPATVSARQLPASPSSLVPIDSHRSCLTNTGSLLSYVFTGRSLGSGKRVPLSSHRRFAAGLCCISLHLLRRLTSLFLILSETIQHVLPEFFLTRARIPALRKHRCAARHKHKHGRGCGSAGGGGGKTCSLVVLALT